MPLSLAVGFAMIASYLLSSTFVPVLSVWLLRGHRHGASRRRTATGDCVDARCATRLTAICWDASSRLLRASCSCRPICVAAWRSSAVVGQRLGREIFPAVDAGQFQLRFRAPAGTRVRATERLAREVLDEIRRAGRRRTTSPISLGYVGVQPSSLSDQHDLPVDRRPGGGRAAGRAQAGAPRARSRPIRGRRCARRLRRAVPGRAVLVRAGRHRQPRHELRLADADRGGGHAARTSPRAGPLPTKVRGRAGRDSERCATCSIGQALDYPTVEVERRPRAGRPARRDASTQVGRSLVAATSSSRFVVPNYWADPQAPASATRCRSRCRSRA